MQGQSCDRKKVKAGNEEATRRRPKESERLLEAARVEFRRSGTNASLEEIGNPAGVGPGTLYRHSRRPIGTKARGVK